MWNKAMSALNMWCSLSPCHWSATRHRNQPWHIKKTAKHCDMSNSRPHPTILVWLWPRWRVTASWWWRPLGLGGSHRPALWTQQAHGRRPEPGSIDINVISTVHTLGIEWWKSHLDFQTFPGLLWNPLIATGFCKVDKNNIFVFIVLKTTLNYSLYYHEQRGRVFTFHQANMKKLFAWICLICMWVDRINTIQGCCALGFLELAGWFSLCLHLQVIHNVGKLGMSLYKKTSNQICCNGTDKVISPLFYRWEQLYSV